MIYVVRVLPQEGYSNVSSEFSSSELPDPP